MTHNNEKAPEQGGEKELKGLLKTIVTVASKSWDAAVLHTRDVSSHPPTYPNKQTFINNLMEEYAKEYAASQNNQGEGNCKCDNEIKTGQTSAMCCNICGLPDDENWKVPSPLPGTTVQGYSEAQLETAWQAFRMRGFPHNTDSYGNETFNQFIQSLNKKR